MQNIISIQTTYDNKNYILTYLEDLGGLIINKIDEVTTEKIDEINKDFINQFPNPQDYTIQPTIELQNIDDEVSYINFLFSFTNDEININHFLNEITTTLEDIEVKRKDLIKLKQVLANRKMITSETLLMN